MDVESFDLSIPYAGLRAKTAIRSLIPSMSDIAPMPRNALLFHRVLPASEFVVFKLESSESTDSTMKPAFSTQLLMLFLVNPQRCHGGLSKGPLTPKHSPLGVNQTRYQ
jgi:hypothetical protein